jgi:diketogulonate reductase-like aldo/keto reductase
MTGSTAAMRELELACGERWPALGLGTWRLGEAPAQRRAEVAALRHALDLGYRLIDSAEMYGEGGAETVVGEALAQALRGGLPRDAVRMVSKAYPHHADPAGLRAACERSRQRLQLDCIDLYLLHWRGSVPLAQTVAGFQDLQRRGWIRHWGVSNFDVDDLQELSALPGGTACAVNQVYFSLGARGVEYDLLPWQRERQMPLMAYSPIDQGALASHPALRALAMRLGATPAQLALAWVLAQPGVMAIPKALRAAHLKDNWQAQHLCIDDATRAQLDRLFPPPRAKQPLAMI